MALNAARSIMLVLVAGLCFAQDDFPSHPVDIVTHASPGGGTDATARSMVAGTKAALGVDMAVVPRTGGGGIVAMNYVNSRPRDGYTVMAITPTHLFAIARGQGPLKIDDLVGVVRATDDPLIVMVQKNSAVHSLGDLIELGHRRPIKWGATQIGGIDHVAGAMLAQAARTELSVVPFSGGGEIVTNLMGGNVDAAALNLTEARDQLERGDFRALAVMGRDRLEALPEVPTTVELGYDVVYSTVRGYVVLRGTPEATVAKLESAMLEGMHSQAYLAYLASAGLGPSGIAGRAVWDAQIRKLYDDARSAMISLGIVKP